MKQAGHLHFFLASVTGALLLTISWQPFGLVFPVFAGFVPLLWMAHTLHEQNRSAGLLLLYAYLQFALWNVGTTWWVWNSSAEGALMAFTLNSLLMCLPVMVYFLFLRRLDVAKANSGFIFLWIAFEYAHHNWEGNWPWLTLGNVFSVMPFTVQWYEYTGVFGGSLWVLVVNLQLFKYLSKWKDRTRVKRYSVAFNLLFFGFVAPVFVSFYTGSNVQVNGRNLNVLVIQPNIDPYKDKFDGMTPVEQTRKMLGLAEQAMDSSIELVCFPETALVGNLDESNLENNTCVLLMRQFLLAHPQVSILTGADTYRFFMPGQRLSKTARKTTSGDAYYDNYNTGMMLNPGQDIEVYHKAKLVPGVERLPYADALGFIKKLTIDLGGTSGSLGSDSVSRIFWVGPPSNHKWIAPVICYESVYGEYVSTYIKQGAGVICVITNDGWWGNTPGFKQHFDYGRLRAIETRRFIARSANTGISGFIDPKGNVLARSEWWTEAAMKHSVVLNTSTTFYVQYGDYLGVIALMYTALNLFYCFRRPRKLNKG